MFGHSTPIPTLGANNLVKVYAISQWCHFKSSESSHLHGKLKQAFSLWCVVNVDYPGVKLLPALLA